MRRAAGRRLPRPALELWLNQHVEYGKKLAELVIKQAQSRLRSAQRSKRRNLRRGRAAGQADRLRILGCDAQ
jgi:CRP-like cAMP-binding protein